MVWKDTGTFVDIPEDEWMKIPLRSDWESRMPKKAPRSYPLGTEDRKVVDKTFDELHELDRMSWSRLATPFSFPVFVVWRTLPYGERKGRVVVDNRILNQMALSDIYPLPLQSDIIALAQGCPFITVIDCASFFYQWRVHPSDRHKLTVMSHRGQEHFNVCTMGFKNSPAYVQRQIDLLLRKYPWARAYIDDVVIASKTLDEHVQHLQALFQLFASVNISINPKKAFLGYLSIRILGQHVDSLRLSTDAKKLEAISHLQFPETLKELEIYLGLTGYLRQYVPFYAAVSAPLQDRKTLLLKKGPASGPQRRNFTQRTPLLNPTEAERLSFKSLQELLSTPTYLVHFDPNRRLYADIDASKAFGFGVVVYHVKDDGSEALTAAADCSQTSIKGGAARPESKPEYPKKSAIEPILFLSRRLSPAEHRYWPTELEIAGLVWCLRKIRYMAESSKLPVRIYTDHGASLGIAKQHSLETTSAERSNLRLVRASEYIQRFNIELCYKAGKSNTVPDALSRLPSSMPVPKDPELDFAFADFVSTEFPFTELVSSATATAYNFTATLAEMSNEFKQRLLEGYEQDPDYDRIIRVINSNDKIKDPPQIDHGQPVDSNKANLPFTRDEDGLIWHTASGAPRLCIPQNLIREVLEIAHTNVGHPGAARTFERAASSWYIRKLGHHVQEFVRHCPECLVYQTRRHSPYGSLQPIQNPNVPFHTISMDFILVLPRSREGYDSVMSVTCKFSKRVTLVPGKKTWTAKQWAEALLERLWIADWGLPKVILSDRDKKFLSDFWSTLFNRLGVQLLYSTAYHPQTDGQSEKTNQTVEIMLRFFLATLENPADWLRCLPQIQSVLNNSKTSTNKTPNEIVYGFTPNFIFDYVADPSIDFPTSRIDAADALDFAAMNMKYYYDRRHTAMFLAPGDWALLRLHHGYNIPIKFNYKLDQQYTGPFKVLEKVGRLSYRLQLPEHWRIHDVFTIAQLEPAPAPGSDPYQRLPYDEPGPVEDTDVYEVERILDKRVIHKGRGFSTQYRVQWKGWGSQYDQWYRVQDLGDCKELIEEYEQRIHQRDDSVTPALH